jgi:hypothetical protein
MFVLLENSAFEEGARAVEVTKVPEMLKKFPEGLLRSTYLLETDQVEAFASGRKEKLYGPFCLNFSVRRARDLLSEGCNYQGISIEIENNGRKLPQLPAASELERILTSETCLIYVNGSPFKPSTEVFTFQQVYDDSVRCIDVLKKMGIPQETIAIYATPEDISIEVHPGVLGLEGRENLDALYYRVLCQLAEIREIDGKVTKTEIKTIVLDSCRPESRILVPGSTHQTLHRTKVSVGPSHFAYGVAAFSDFCAKKRSVQECIQESLNWLKFLQTQLPPIAGFADKIQALPDLPIPGLGSNSGAKLSKASSGRFQPLAQELVGAGECYQELMPAFATPFATLDKSLGGGWLKGGLHLLVGPRGGGKGALLIQQALKAQKDSSVLFVSFEQDVREFSIRSAFSGGNTSLIDLCGQLANPDGTGLEARKLLAAGVEKFRGSLSENLFFSGIGNSHSTFDVDEILELTRMLPDSGPRLVILESLDEQLLEENFAEKLQALRRLAISERATFLLSIHEEFECGKRPHFIEGTDQALLAKYQRHCDSLIVCMSEKLNLRRFVAMVKGQIDAQLIGKLEQKALQLAGGRRCKNDSYTNLRLIHSRLGRKELILCLYQPDYVRFFEIASLPISRP